MKAKELFLVVLGGSGLLLAGCGTRYMLDVEVTPAGAPNPRIVVKDHRQRELYHGPHKRIENVNYDGKALAVTVLADGFLPKTLEVPFKEGLALQTVRAPLDGVKTFTFEVEPAEGAVLEIDGKVNTGWTTTLAFENDGYGHLKTHTAVIKREGYEDWARVLTHATDPVVTVKLQKKTEDLVTDYYLARPDRANAVIELRERLDWAVFDTADALSPVAVTDFKEMRYLDQLAVSPDGETIAFVEYKVNEETKKVYSNIFTVSAKSGKKLTTVFDENNRKYLNLFPTFFPDPERPKIVFASNKDESPNLRLFSVPQWGGAVTEITATACSDLAPHVSPDGNWVAFQRYAPNVDKSTLRTIPTKGAPTSTEVHQDWALRPRWANDSRKLLYISPVLKDARPLVLGSGKQTCYPSQLFTINADSTLRTQLTFDEEIEIRAADWSPDGRRIVFSWNKSIAEGRRNFDIYVMNADGGHPNQLTTNRSVDDDPVFGPEGRYVYFRSNRGGRWNIWKIEVPQ